MRLGNWHWLLWFALWRGNRCSGGWCLYYSYLLCLTEHVIDSTLLDNFAVLCVSWTHWFLCLALYRTDVIVAIRLLHLESRGSSMGVLHIDLVYVPLHAVSFSLIVQLWDVMAFSAVFRQRLRPLEFFFALLWALQNDSSLPHVVLKASQANLATDCLLFLTGTTELFFLS